MIQFNLLPDVKLEFVRAKRMQHTVVSASVIAAGSAFVIFLLLFLAVNVVQKNTLSSATNEIKKDKVILNQTPELAKILTIQNQLAVLPSLHAKKAAASRSFEFLQLLTPTSVTISDATTDFILNTVTITGQSNGLDKINIFADTLKFTKYSDDKVKGQLAFTGVVLTAFSKSSTAATYTITANFAPALYDNVSAVVLSVPNTVTTRSVIEQPADLFKQPATKSSEVVR